MQTLPQSSALAVKFAEGDIVKLSEALGACLIVQRTYGKQGEDIKTLTKIFLEDLKEFTPEKVLSAIKSWRKTQREFPTPADIMGILDPKPVLDKSVYLSIQDKRKKQGGEYLSDKEWKYIAAYEKEVVG